MKRVSKVFARPTSAFSHYSNGDGDGSHHDMEETEEEGDDGEDVGEIRRPSGLGDMDMSMGSVAPTSGTEDVVKATNGSRGGGVRSRNGSTRGGGVAGSMTLGHVREESGEYRYSQDSALQRDQERRHGYPQAPNAPPEYRQPIEHHHHHHHHHHHYSQDSTTVFGDLETDSDTGSESDYGEQVEVQVAYAYKAPLASPLRVPGSPRASVMGDPRASIVSTASPPPSPLRTKEINGTGNGLKRTTSPKNANPFFMPEPGESRPSSSAGRALATDKPLPAAPAIARERVPTAIRTSRMSMSGSSVYSESSIRGDGDRRHSMVGSPPTGPPPREPLPEPPGKERRRTRSGTVSAAPFFTPPRPPSSLPKHSPSPSPRTCSTPTPPPPPPPRIHTLPPSLLRTLLSRTYLSTTALTSVARVSRVLRPFADAALYSVLEDPPSAALRPGKAELVRRLELSSWDPSAFRGSYYTPSAALNWRLSLERMIPLMVHLEELEIPTFDARVMQGHSAFGLRRVVFGNGDGDGGDEGGVVTLGKDEWAAVVRWLDGMVNVVEVKWPLLVEEAGVAAPTSPMGPEYPPGLKDDSLFTQPAGGGERKSTLLVPRRPTTPTSPTPSLVLHDKLRSSTLLPHLTHLHAPPAIVMALCQRPRPLVQLTVTLTTPLYAGFKPAALWRVVRDATDRQHFASPPPKKDGPLTFTFPQKDGGSTLRALHLVFGRALDKRTRDKVLRVAAKEFGGVRELGVQEMVSSARVEIPQTAAQKRRQAEEAESVERAERERTRALWQMVLVVLPAYPAVETVRVAPGSREYAVWLGASWEGVRGVVYPAEGEKEEEEDADTVQEHKALVVEDQEEVEESKVEVQGFSFGLM
ncbi:hypothetical protein BDZ89DRAFT_1131795 [Hymenopellis radicata]|nr:hypothetical protein BDZ89DRAFT_1131795 [Hymenopellis radicata]